ncbi:MAG: hypothetical protein LBQ69_03200 [Treponema sp.]|jgi:hypothetical protein|nr:hypothetical protein [Treponema sp.]
MSGSGKYGDNQGNRRKNRKRRDRENTASKNEGKKAAGLSPLKEGRFEKTRGGLVERPKWTPPKPPAFTMPQASCAWCEKPIKDMASAIRDPDSGQPVHFECVLSRIAGRENLESGDTVSYIGGGRFGVVHYNNPSDTRGFKIKKIFEWEQKENRSDWRVAISDYYSVT